MAAGSTYTPIATYTLGSASNGVTFSSIPSTYTDLVLVINYSQATGSNGFSVRFNSDSGSNYSETYIQGNGTTASSFRYSTQTTGDIAVNLGSSTSGASNIICNIMNYSNTTTYKTALTRGNNAGVLTQASVTLWRSTAAINTIQVSLAGSFTSTPTADAGSTFTLYGITAA